MKLTLTFIILFLFVFTKGQIPEKEQWRYVNLNTSLLTLTPEVIYLDSSNRQLTNEEILIQQINDKSILFDTYSDGITISLTEVNDSSINGFLRNGSKDTLKITLNGGFYMDFRTEVKINGTWLPYQTSRPFNCGMGIGQGNLFPSYKCKISLDKSTTGSKKLPFRLKLRLANEEFISNEILISCSQQQFKLIPHRIKEYTF